MYLQTSPSAPPVKLDASAKFLSYGIRYLILYNYYFPFINHFHSSRHTLEIFAEPAEGFKGETFKEMLSIQYSPFDVIDKQKVQNRFVSEFCISF